MAELRCTICGEIIPEGRQVCPICEKKIKAKEKNQEHYEAVAEVIADSGYHLSREKHRQITKLPRDQFSKWVARLYGIGYRDGVKAAQEALAQKVDYTGDRQVDSDDLMQTLASIRGIGPKTMQNIESTLIEKYG